MLSKLWNTLNTLSSKKPLKYTLYLSAIIIFFAIILIPPIIGILIKIANNPKRHQPASFDEYALGAISNSFIIGLIVAALDLLAGVPLAWLITRGKSRWLSVLDTLADLPFIVPTALWAIRFCCFGVQAGGNISTFWQDHSFLLVGFWSCFCISLFHSQLLCDNGWRNA